MVQHSEDLPDTASASTSLKDLSRDQLSQLSKDELVELVANAKRPRDTTAPHSTIKKIKSQSHLPSSHAADTIIPANDIPANNPASTLDVQRTTAGKKGRQVRDSWNDSLMSSTDASDLPARRSGKKSLLRDLSDLEPGRSSLEELGDESPAEEVLSEEKHAPSTPLRYHATKETVLSSPAGAPSPTKTPSSREPLTLMNQLQRKRRSKRKSTEKTLVTSPPGKATREKGKRKNKDESPKKGSRRGKSSATAATPESQPSPSQTEVSKAVRVMVVPPRERGASQELSHTMSTDDDAEVERAASSEHAEPLPLPDDPIPALAPEKAPENDTQDMPRPVPISMSSEQEAPDISTPATIESSPCTSDMKEEVNAATPTDDTQQPSDQDKEAVEVLSQQEPPEPSPPVVPVEASDAPAPDPAPAPASAPAPIPDPDPAPAPVAVPSQETVVVKKKRPIPMIVVSSDEVTDSVASAELSVEVNPPVPSFERIMQELPTRSVNEDDEDSIDDSYDISADDEPFDTPDEGDDSPATTDDKRTVTALLRMMGGDPAPLEEEERKQEEPVLDESIYVKRKEPLADDPCRYVEIGKGTVLKNLKGVQIESETGKKIKENLVAQKSRRFISVGGGGGSDQSASANSSNPSPPADD